MSRPELLHAFFDRSWREAPDRVAIDVPTGRKRSNRVRATYGELGQRSRVLGARLRPLVTGESIVALLVPRTRPDAFAAQLAVLRSGAAFACIDPAAPDARVADILADAGPAAVIGDDESADRAARLGIDRARILNLDRLDGEPPDLAGDEPPSWLTPATLAYLIYTSGTTGRPKGVMIEHRSIANLVASDLDEFGLTAADRVGQSSSHAYDSSIEETWLAFAAGATLVVMDDDVVRAGPDLPAWLADERISVFCPAPTLLRATGCRDPRLLSSLRLLYVGGETLPRDVAQAWSAGRRLVNGYGPTECAVTAIRCDITDPDRVPIGRPVRHLQAWILDESMNEVAEGQRGELYLGGIGLARGYWRAPALTAARFPTHPRLGRLYRTGDVAHVGRDGLIYCHGRVDSQVKLRGHRIELEDVEAHLTRCPGVRAAACTVATKGGAPRLLAFIVPDAEAPPTIAALRSRMADSVPAHMVPTGFDFVTSLPTTVGGKLDRRALPVPADDTAGVPASAEVAAADPVEALVLTAARGVFGHTPLGVDDDFFGRLGGDSLRAAQLVTALREHALTRHLAVRDVYEAPTVRELAGRARAPQRPAEGGAGAAAPARPTFWFTTSQGLVVAGWLSFIAVVSYAAVVVGAPRLVSAMGLEPFVLVLPPIAAALMAMYTLLTIAVAVIVKRVVIGRYTAMRAPLWGWFHFRVWVVEHSVRRIPWRLLEETEVQSIVLRLLGARVGRRVHIHRGVDLRHGGWDLLELGDDVSLGRDVSIDLIDVREGAIHIDSIAIGRGATIETGAGLSGNTIVGAEASLTALSSLPQGARVPDGERWSGVPAERAGRTAPVPAAAVSRRLGPVTFAAVVAVVRFAAATVAIGPAAAAILAIAATGPWTADDLLAWLAAPGVTRDTLPVLLAVALVPLPLVVVMQAIAARALGRVNPGVVDRWSLTYIRAAVKIELVESAGIWLAGSLLWPAWLRLAGMEVGSACEISTILDVVPDLVSIGAGSFLTDGIYVASPHVTRGTVTLAPTRLGRNSFIGNRAVVPVGQRLPADVLIGVSTVADDSRMLEGSSWFGHPPFDLHRRPAAEFEQPTLVLFFNRLFWEALRFALPLPLLAVNIAWFSRLAALGSHMSAGIAAIVIATTAGAGAVLLGLVLGLKWLLLGRVSAGQHKFWSCWCMRWDFHYVAWDRLARPILQRLEGTLLLAWYLRAMGCRIGRRVLLGAGFAQVVDPDMLVVEDDAIVLGMLQAHTFEDRILKIDKIYIGRGATVSNHALLFYGARIGEGAYVAPHSVVMKHEGLLPGQAYQGCPTRPMRREAPGRPPNDQREALKRDAASAAEPALQ